MATFTFDPDGFTLDESSGLQDGTNGFPATEDDNDDDIAVGGLPDPFKNFLTNLGWLPDPFVSDIGVGESSTNFIQVEGDGGTDVTDLNFSTTAGGALPVFGSGDPLVDSGINVLAGAGGGDDNIYLFSDDASGTVAAAGLLGKVVLGMTADGDVAFALYLQNTDTDGDDDLTNWQVYSVQFEAFDNPSPDDGTLGTHDEPVTVQNLGVAASEEIFFNFANTPAGKLYFAMYVQSGTAQDDDQAIGIIATSDDPPNSGFSNDTTGQEKTEGNKHLNTSKGGGPTTHGVENQSAGEGESLTYSLVVNPNRDFVINQPTSGENVTEGAIDGNSGPLGVEANIQFDSYFSGAPGGFFTVVKIAGGGGGERTVIDIAAFLNTDDTDKESNYDNANGLPDTAGNADGVRDGDEAVQQIEAIRVFSVVLDKEGFVVEGSKVLLFDSNAHANGHNDIHVINLGTDKVSVAGVPENAMIEFDLEDGDLWNMLEISKSVPDGNYDASNPFAAGQTYNIANVGVASADVDGSPLPGVRFEDDGPVLDIALSSTATLELDETDNDADDGDVGGLLATDTITAAALFTPVTEDGGSDGLDASQTSYAFEDPGTDVDSGLVDTLSGQAVVYNLVGGDIVGTTETGGDLVIRYTIDASTGLVTSEQSRAVVHPDDTSHDETLTHPGSNLIVVTKTIFDNDDDFASDSVDITPIVKIDDDGPEVTVSPDAGESELAALELSHDETIGTDRYNGAEPQDNDGDADDTAATAVTVSLLPALAAAIGKTETAGGGEIGALFGVTTDFGSDGEGNTIDTDGRTDQLSLVLSDDPLETNLVATALAGGPLETLDETARTIWLVADSTDPDTRVNGVIAGEDGVVDGDADEYMVFSIVLENPTNLTTAKLVTYHFIPIDHDLSEEPDAEEAPEDPSLFDEEIELATVAEGATVSIRLETTIEDGDEDTDTDDALVPIVDNEGSFLAFDDDGPIAAIAETGTDVLHDETAGVDADSDDQELVDLPAAFAALAAGAGAVVQGWAESSGAVVEVDDTSNDFGTDGEAASGAVAFSLAIPADGTDSGLVAIIDPVTGETRQVSLFAETWDGVDIIVGRIDDEFGGAVSTNTVALAVMIDSETGVLSVMQSLPMFHLVGGVNVSTVSIDDDALQAVLTIKDGDFDLATESTDIGNRVVIRDDGPDESGAVDRDIEEDDLTISSVGLNEDESVDAHQDLNFNLEPLVEEGYDRPLTFSLKAADAAEKTATEAALAAANPGLSSKGEAVLFDVNGTTNTVTLFVDNGDGVLGGDDRLVGTWTVTAAGLATYTALDQLDHALAAERIEASEDALTPGLFNDNDQEDELVVNLTAALRVVDHDLTEVDFSDEPNFIRYVVEDDMPDIGDSGANVSDGTEDIIPDGLIEFSSSGPNNTVTVNLEAVLGTDEGVNPSIAGSGGVTITSFDPSIVYSDSDGNPVLTLTGVQVSDDVVQYQDQSDGNKPYFQLTIDDSNADSTQWTYTWEAFEDPPFFEQPVDFSAIQSGSPIETLSPPIGSGSLVAVFDGLLFATETAPNNWTPDANGGDPGGVDLAFGDHVDHSNDGIIDRPDGQGFTDETADNENANNEGFGIKGGPADGAKQSSQFNHNEGTWATVVDTKGTLDTGDDEQIEMSSFTFHIEGIGKPTTFHIDWQMIDDGEVVSFAGGGAVISPDGTMVAATDSGTVGLTTLQGNNEVEFSITRSTDETFDAIYIRTWWDGAVENEGVRLLDFSIGVPGQVDDRILAWDVEITDFDGDTDQASFQTGIDGDLDGDVDGLGIV